MKKVVLTIKEDICEKNGKDPNATELLSVATHYGSVEDFSVAVDKVKGEYQATIDNLSNQLASIKEQELTPDEIEMVKAYRKNKAMVVADCEKKINAMAETLRLGNEKLAQAKAVISAQLEKLSE